MGWERFIFANLHVAPEGGLTPWMDDRQASVNRID